MAPSTAFVSKVKSTLVPISHAEGNLATAVWNQAMIRTVYTDVVVLAIFTWTSLSLDEQWIAFGVGTKFKYIAVHEIVSNLGSDRCN